MAWWAWLALLAFLAWLAWLAINGSGGGATTPGATAPPPPPPAYPSNPTSYAVGTPPIPQGAWTGPGRHQRRTTLSYTFTRTTYDVANPLDPIAASVGVRVRFRLQVAPEEQASITAATNGGAVDGTAWWGAVTDGSGQVVVDVAVGPREDIGAQSDMLIIAEELASDGTAARGATHTVRIVPPGQ